MNGNLIHSSSRTQHVVSLSSTEAEYYAMTSTCIDTIYIKHILEFLLDREVEAHVKVDNSATRQIANKLGTSKLRHVHGKLLWVQNQVKNGVIKLKQIPTLWNPADLGTKGLSRKRHNLLLYLFGFVDEKGEKIGEVEYHETKLEETTKNAIKRAKLVIPGDLSLSSSTSSQVAKQAVRLAMLEVVGALGQVVTDEPNAVTNDVSSDMVGYGQLVRWFCFAGIAVALMAVFVYMMVDNSDSESGENSEARRRRYLFSTLDEVSDPEEWMALNHHDYSSSSRCSQDTEPEVETDAAGPRVETPLQYGMYHVYLFMQGCFQRLRHLMQTDHAMQGRGYAILYNLLRVLRNYERHGITSREADHMTLMNRSLTEMEGVMRARGGSVLALQDEGQARLYQEFSDNLALEPDMEEPSAEEISERGIRVWDGDLPPSDQPGSPECMAKWLIRRLTRRIVVSCVERRPAMCRYMAMRETLRDVLRACSRSEFNRSRAMVMMHEITDLSEHESSLDDELQDPFRYMMTGIPDGDHLYEQVLLDDDDYEVNAARAHGPLDARGLVESSSTIPPYITINDQRYYTAAYEDLPTDAELEEHGADWALYYVPQLRHHYRVRRWETNEETRMRSGNVSRPSHGG